MKIKFYQALALFAIVLLANSCVTKPQAELNKASYDLERVEESENYSGKISVSDLNFVANKGQFNVNYNEDASNYVQAARVNISGDASSSIQTAMFLGATLQGSFTAPISAGQPPGTNAASPSAPNLPTQAETAINGFSAPPSLSGLNPTADEREAVEKGINDKLAEEFLEFMANPTVDSNKEAIVFGVMQATCEPGQNTKKGFIAEMDISLKYARAKAIKAYNETTNISQVVGLDQDTQQLIRNNRVFNMFDTNIVVTTNRTIQIADDGSMTTNTMVTTNYVPVSNMITNNQGETYYLAGTNTDIEIQTSGRPSVLAVLPLMDSRNMELQNNNQSQVEIAAALSAAFQAKGLTAAANILSDYVKRQQSNIQTFNSLPVTTAYADGSDFGFQLYPAAEAVENPGQYSPAANVLEPVTFPIVVALKVEKSDVEATDTNSPPWNLLVTETHSHWIPIKWGNWHRFWLNTDWIVEWPSKLFGDYDYFAYQPDYQLMYRARLLDKAKICLTNVAPDGTAHPLTIPQPYSLEYHQLEMAYDTLRNSALSIETYRELPDFNVLFPPKGDTNAPSIVDVFPHTIWRDTNTDMLILVKGTLTPSEVTNVLIGGVSCQTTDVVQYVSHTVAGDSGTTNLALEAVLPPYFYSITNSVTNSVDFAVEFNDKPPATKSIGLLLQGRSLSDANVTLTRDANSKLLGIDVKPGDNLSATNLLDVIKAVLKKSEPPPKTVNIIH